MRVFIVVAALLSSCAAPRVADDNQSREALADSLDRPYYSEASDAAKAAGVDYRALMLSAVKKNPAALRKLVHLCTNPHFDGAGLEVHLQFLRQLLTLWGDRDFAAAIHRFSSKERKILQGHWTFSDRRMLTKDFPLTARLIYGTDEI